MESIKLSLSGRLWERPTGYMNTLEDQIPVARRLGYGGMEVRYPLLPAGDDIARVRAKFQEAGMEPTMCFCASMPQNAAQWEDALRVIRTLSALGAPRMRIVISNPEQYAIARELADKAAPHNVRLIVHYHINTYCDSAARAVEIMEGIGHPNVRLLFDPAHVALAGDADIAGITERLLPWTDYINIQDFRRTDADAGDIKGYNGFWLRNLPGEPGGLDFAAFVGTLKKIGYKGWLNVMSATAPMDAKDPVATAQAYAEHFAKLL